MPDILCGMLAVQLYGVHTSPGEFHTIMEAVEERGDTRKYQDGGNDITDLPCLDELEVGFLEYALGEFGEIFEMTAFVQVDVSDQPGNNDTCE